MSGAIVRGAHVPLRGKGGGRSYQRLKGFLRYVAYGRHAGRQAGQAARGAWRDQQGRPVPQAAVERWAWEKTHRLGYDHAYQLLLSTRTGGLDAADFNRALAAGGELSGVGEWRFMLHADSDHQHAHAVLFRREKLDRAAYREMQQAMQKELAGLQAAREAGLESAPEEAPQSAWELEHG